MTSPSIANREVHSRAARHTRFGIGSDHDKRGAIGQTDALAGLDVRQLRGRVGGGPQFDDPDVVVECGREMHGDWCGTRGCRRRQPGASRSCSRPAGRQGARCSLRSANRPCTTPPGVAIISLTPSRATPCASGGSTASDAGGRSKCVCGFARVMRLLRPSTGRVRGSGRARAVLSRSRSSAGTTDSGSARSEMSSPGKAAWCISVRMSPGSNAYTPMPGFSAAKIAERWSSAAFDDP